jgi:hypothetical protein
MFFRRETPKTPTFADRLDALRAGGFTVAGAQGGIVRVTRGECAIDLRDDNGIPRPVAPAGIVIGEETGALIDGGYQKFFRTPSGVKRPALAEQLKALHEFEEDLREGLGLQSLYNESLGTVSTFYLYDRVKDRDKGVPKRVWD